MVKLKVYIIISQHDLQNQDSVLVGHSSDYFELPSPPLYEDLAIFNGKRRRSPAYIARFFGIVEPRLFYAMCI